MSQNQSDDNTTSSHVAWADRTGLNKQWKDDIHACSEAFGTPWYMVMVRRFIKNIPNIHNGPKLKDMIKEYEYTLFKNNLPQMMREYLDNFPDDAGCESTLLMKEDEFRMVLSENLYEFIIQVLEDNGFCFYKSNVEIGSGRSIEYED